MVELYHKIGGIWWKIPQQYHNTCSCWCIFRVYSCSLWDWISVFNPKNAFCIVFMVYVSFSKH